MPIKIPLINLKKVCRSQTNPISLNDFFSSLRKHHVAIAAEIAPNIPYTNLSQVFGKNKPIKLLLRKSRRIKENQKRMAKLKEPVLLLSFVASDENLINLRRGRDSNPRYGFPYIHFPGVPLQPLEHLSVYNCEGSKNSIYSLKKVLNFAVYLLCLSVRPIYSFTIFILLI